LSLIVKYVCLIVDAAPLSRITKTFLLNSKAEKYHVEQIFWYSKMIGNFSINWSSGHETCESDCYVSNHFLNCISCLNDCYKFNLRHHLKSTYLMKLLSCHSTQRLPVGYHNGNKMEPLRTVYGTHGNEGQRMPDYCKGVEVPPFHWILTVSFTQ